MERLPLPEDQAVIDAGRELEAVRRDEESGSGGMETGLDGGEADRDGAEHRAQGRTGDDSDRIGIARCGGPDLGTGDGEWALLGRGRGIREFAAESDEGALRMAAGFHAGDDFLPEVAALLEAHTVVKHAGFMGEGVGAEVDVVERSACFDANCLMSTGGRTRGFRSRTVTWFTAPTRSTA